MPQFLTRASLSEQAARGHLAGLLYPRDPHRQLDAHHRAMWTLFRDPDHQRDFLWRAESAQRFLVLSARRPEPNALFEPLETKTFAPVLAHGNSLRFTLRANATIDQITGTRRNGRLRRGVRTDIIASRHHAGTTAHTPDNGDTDALRAWLARLGMRHGFTIETFQASNYAVRRLLRPGARSSRLGIVDLSGTITLDNPGAFARQQALGFGRGRAFGCGLMLIARIAHTQANTS